MRRNLIATTGALTGALALAAAMAVPAQAATSDGDAGIVGCGTTGAYGDMPYSNYHGPDAKINVKFSLTDTKADGLHVRIRMISKDVRGAITYWPWRANTLGQNRTREWTTTAQHDRGLFWIGVQVARVDGSRVVNMCTDWK